MILHEMNQQGKEKKRLGLGKKAAVVDSRKTLATTIND